MTNKLVIILCILIFLVSCNQEKNINAKIYSNNRAEDLYGTFYATKYGGLNYYITDEQQRESVLSMNNIDSIVFSFNDRVYVAEPLIRQSFSRERNNSDISFFINKTDNKIIVDTVNNMKTILLFSEKTDIEKLKDNHKVKFHPVDK
ncbi:MAG: hypothetical protein E2604_00355 [Flavobacterium sp.]|nr:hypothetical protein [Flavobacterium sp.]